MIEVLELLQQNLDYLQELIELKEHYLEMAKEQEMLSTLYFIDLQNARDSISGKQKYVLHSAGKSGMMGEVRVV